MKQKKLFKEKGINLKKETAWTFEDDGLGGIVPKRQDGKRGK